MSDLDDPRCEVLVLGIGNLLWADEGFGVRCVEQLAAQWLVPEGITVMDGGTQGLYLLPYVQGAQRLIVFDAIDYGLPPGTMKRVEGDAVPRFMGAKKMSLHQTGFQEVLMLAQLTECYPREVLLIGCQPEVLDDYGGSLRACTRAALAPAVALAVERLAAWGAAPRVRGTPPAPGEALTAPVLALAAYEDGRPDAGQACRVGDVRFLAGLSSTSR